MTVSRKNAELIARGAAANLDLDAAVLRCQAEMLRGATPEAVEASRAAAHAVLDALIDLKGELAQASRDLFGR